MDDVIDDIANDRFELRTPEGDAVAVYERQGDVLAFVHTEVPAGERGQGIGDRLIAGAISQLRDRGERFVPACEFVAGYVDRHPDVRDLVVGQG